MKIEFNDHYELRQFCRDYIESETSVETADLSRRLEVAEDKARELQRQKEAMVAAQPQPFSSEHDQVLRALAKDCPDTLRAILRKLSPDNRINQIKMIRTIYGCGLKEGKEFVDGTIFALEIARW